jgi:hypothetical protein
MQEEQLTTIIMWSAIGIIVLGVGFLVGTRYSSGGIRNRGRYVDMQYAPVYSREMREEDMVEMSPLSSIHGGAVSRKPSTPR